MRQALKGDKAYILVPLIVETPTLEPYLHSIFQLATLLGPIHLEVLTIL